MESIPPISPAKGYSPALDKGGVHGLGGLTTGMVGGVFEGEISRGVRMDRWTIPG